MQHFNKREVVLLSRRYQKYTKRTLKAINLPVIATKVQSGEVYIYRYSKNLVMSYRK